MEDYYVWKAQMEDDSIILQYKEDGTPTKWEELDFDKIKYWILEPLQKQYKRIIFGTKKGFRPIYWRHNIKQVFKQSFHLVCYKFGYQETVNGKNKKTILFIYPNGDIEVLLDTDEPKLMGAFLKAVENVKKTD